MNRGPVPGTPPGAGRTSGGSVHRGLASPLRRIGVEGPLQMDRQELLNYWESLHQELTDAQRQSFLAKDEVTLLCALDETITKEAVRRNPKLARACVVARSEMESARLEADRALAERAKSLELKMLDDSETEEAAAAEQAAAEPALGESLLGRFPADEPYSVESDENEELEPLNLISQETGTYRCVDCGLWFPLEAFQFVRNGKTKVARRCEECRAYWRARSRPRPLPPG